MKNCWWPCHCHIRGFGSDTYSRLDNEQLWMWGIIDDKIMDLWLNSQLEIDNILIHSGWWGWVMKIDTFVGVMDEISIKDNENIDRIFCGQNEELKLNKDY